MLKYLTRDQLNEIVEVATRWQYRYETENGTLRVDDPNEEVRENKVGPEEDRPLLEALLTALPHEAFMELQTLMLLGETSESTKGDWPSLIAFVKENSELIEPISNPYLAQHLKDGWAKLQDA